MWVKCIQGLFRRRPRYYYVKSKQVNRVIAAAAVGDKRRTRSLEPNRGGEYIEKKKLKKGHRQIFKNHSRSLKRPLTIYIYNTYILYIYYNVQDPVISLSFYPPSLSIYSYMGCTIRIQVPLAVTPVNRHHH